MFSTSKLFLSATSLRGIGGDITFSGSYIVHTFTSNDTFTLLNSSLVADILVVAGGGGGGYAGGGGGAGGVIYQENITLTNPSYNITIGAGGARATLYQTSQHPVITSRGYNGGNSTFGSLYTAIGGGGGGSHNTGSNWSWNSNPNGRTNDDGSSGGSGGGAAFNWGIGSLGGQQYPVGGAGTSGQGNSGGSSCLTGGDTTRRAGGGGGAGAAGQGNCATPHGGIGRLISINGNAVYYGGGGGGWDNGAGGQGGGGNYGVNGAANTGGGAGGYADGGSGIVIVRYLK